VCINNGDISKYKIQFPDSRLESVPGFKKLCRDSKNCAGIQNAVALFLKSRKYVNNFKLDYLFMRISFVLNLMEPWRIIFQQMEIW
jgi:hypothetical protein